METIEKLPNGLNFIQDDLFFKLGQDSTLLSAFVSPKKFSNVLDLASGVGTLSLLCWRDDLKITGLELQQGAVDIFLRSIKLNNLKNVTALQGDLTKIKNYFCHSSFDYVICNPPYFKYGSGKTKSSNEHTLSRMDEKANIKDVSNAISYVLKYGGKCAVVFRPERLITLISEFNNVGLAPKRIKFVHQTSQKPPSAVLVECRKGSNIDGLIVEPPMIIKNIDNSFTKEYLKIYNKV